MSHPMATVTVYGGVFKAALEVTWKEDHREALKGLFFNSISKGMDIVATDGAKMLRHTLPATSNNEGDSQVVGKLPKKGVILAKEAFPKFNKGQTIRIEFNKELGKALFTTTNGATWTAPALDITFVVLNHYGGEEYRKVGPKPVIEGPYTDYQSLFPKVAESKELAKSATGYRFALMGDMMICLGKVMGHLKKSAHGDRKCVFLTVGQEKGRSTNNVLQLDLTHREDVGRTRMLVMPAREN